MKKLILDYIKNIKKNDILKFAMNNDIRLTDEEINNLYNLLQNKNILDYDDNRYYKLLKDNLNSQNYRKSIDIFDKYKKKYQSYL